MADKNEDLLFAKVAGRYSDGVSLFFPEETEPTQKHYKCAAAAAIRVGDTVKLTRASGTYVVEYVVGGAPAVLKNMNKCPENATAANCAAWINTIIEALADFGFMTKNGW